MKCITLHQPWASLVALGEKRIETRSWPTNHRGTIAIHAGKFHSFRAADCLEPPYRSLLDAHGYNMAAGLPWGAVIATATLTDCIRMSSQWIDDLIREHHQEWELGHYAPGRYAWVLTDVQPLAEPVPARGYQGLWEFDDALIGATR